MPNTTTEPRRMAAVRVYYGTPDGIVTTKELLASELIDLPTAFTAWVQLPDTGIQSVVIYWDETYLIWKGDTQVEENYVTTYAGCDYYFGYLDGTFGAGQAEDVPVGLPQVPGLVKRGAYMPDTAYWSMYQDVKEDRVVPQG